MRIVTACAALVLLVCESPSAFAGKDWFTDDEQAEVASRARWSHTFEDDVREVTALPGGFVSVTTQTLAAITRKKKSDLRRWALDGRTGAILWEGSEDATITTLGDGLLATDQQDERMTLTALDRSGSTTWTRSFDGVGISIVVSGDKLVALYVPGAWWGEEGAEQARIAELSASTGAVDWDVAVSELSLPPFVLSSALEVTPAAVWVAAGGRVVRLSRADGALTASAPLSPTATDGVVPVLAWSATDSEAVIAIDGEVVLIDDSGLRWTATFERRKAMADTIGRAGNTVVVGFRSPKRLGVLGLDLASGTERWRIDERDGFRSPPAGMALGADRVAVAWRGDLHGFDLDSGEETWSLPIGAKRYESALEVTSDGDHAVVHSDKAVQVVDLASGELLAEPDKLERPVVLLRAQMRMAVAVASAGYGAAASMDEMMAQSIVQQANTRWSSSSADDDYVYSPSQRMGLADQASSLRRSSAWSGVAKSLTSALGQGDGVGAPAELPIHVESAPVSGWVVRHRVRDRKAIGGVTTGAAVDLALVELATGSVREIPTVQTATKCIAALAADVEAGLLYQAHRQVALSCKERSRLDGFSLPH